MGSVPVATCRGRHLEAAGQGLGLGASLTSNPTPAAAWPGSGAWRMQRSSGGSTGAATGTSAPPRTRTRRPGSPRTEGGPPRSGAPSGSGWGGQVLRPLPGDDSVWHLACPWGAAQGTERTVTCPAIPGPSWARLAPSLPNSNCWGPSIAPGPLMDITPSGLTISPGETHEPVYRWRN